MSEKTDILTARNELVAATGGKVKGWPISKMTDNQVLCLWKYMKFNPEGFREMAARPSTIGKEGQ